ncbi:hypothetical protein BcDW1_800 [Botrytis cinerea BcDW1]|uniref:Uncharacterized protein n=1 Tax=Botryotinia fuckeliana (strain BcDW1) TaxID=1290391 RepID=M7U3R0_BOTF1|nr:hypothetical protein BcDW1_800 [Botrytis cinerea BcDW1]
MSARLNLRPPDPAKMRHDAEEEEETKRSGNRSRKYEQRIPERSRQGRGNNPLPADDFYAKHVDSMRAKELEKHRNDRGDREIRKREGKEKQKKQDERERRGREEEDRIYEQDTEDPTERDWRANIQESNRIIAEEEKREKSAREPKPRIATHEKTHRDKGGHTKQGVNDEDGARKNKTGTTHVHSSRGGRREKERERERDRSRSRDRDHDRDDVRVGQAPIHTNPERGARHKKNGAYVYSDAYIPKSVPRPEVDDRGDKRRDRAKGNVLNPTGRDPTRHSRPLAPDPRHIRHTDEAIRGYKPHEDPRTPIYYPDPRAAASQVDRSEDRKPAASDPDYYNPRHGMYRR